MWWKHIGKLANNPVVMFCLNNIKKTDRLPVLSMNECPCNTALVEIHIREENYQ